jgi:hypothetical protein
MKLTASNVGKLALGEGEADKIFRDDDLSGFGYRLRRTGTGINRSWIVQYRVGTKQRRISLDAGKFTAGQARKVAKDYLAQVQLGRDPSAERDKVREEVSAITLTVADLADKYLNAQKGVFRPSTFESAERYFNQHLVPLRSRPVDSIKRVEAANCLHSIKHERGATAAARARSTLSAMFVKGYARPIRSLAPMTPIRKPPATGFSAMPSWQRFGIIAATMISAGRFDC